jgi:hypothetical protein
MVTPDRRSGPHGRDKLFTEYLDLTAKLKQPASKMLIIIEEPRSPDKSGRGIFYT